MGDLSRPEAVVEALRRHGWNPERRTFIVVEGLSYYLARPALWNVLRQFRTRDRHNTVVLNCIKRAESIAPDRQRITAKCFHVIADAVGSRRRITRYDRADILRMMRPLGGKFLESWSMHRSELARRGDNTYFPTDKSSPTEDFVFAL